MGDVVNLRMVRKAKARSAKEVAAAENRVRFGRTKQERLIGETTKQVEDLRHEGHKLKRNPDSQ